MILWTILLAIRSKCVSEDSKKMEIKNCQKIFYQISEQKKLWEKKFQKILVLGELHPLKPPVRRTLCSSHSSPTAPLPGPRRFWIESPWSTGYLITLVSVSESDLQKSVRIFQYFEYIINQSINKNRKVVFSWVQFKQQIQFLYDI